ncbi:MAG: pyrroloquinoline quinone biosynthesis protein PqqE [Methanocella sp. PtaU1.Bin125]|nr:MAG: pyrroloquinoline quinone biosynthesis protein PqqE [Methanocella sp. PtaU1.Bin125]
MRTAKINNSKLHLRVEKDGSGLLVVNASQVLYLDRIGVDFVKHYIGYTQKKPLVGSVRDNVVLRVMAKYKVGRKKATEDYDRLMNAIWGVVAGNTCPFTTFDVKVQTPDHRNLKAPLRVDLALTYRCNSNCCHCYANGPHQTKELSTEEWMQIIRKVRDFEVPNVVFTGGESLMRDDLETLILEAERLGIVTGLITNGRLLTKERVASLNKAGLDYTQITIESPDPKIHNFMCRTDSFDETVAGIKNTVKDIYTTTNTTLTSYNKDTAVDLVPFLHGLGIRRFGMNAIIRAGRGVEAEGVTYEELKELLPRVIEKAEELGMEFIWYTPTKYHKFNPVQMGLGVKACSAARITLAIEPDGNVIPCQSYFKPLGNALTDSFEKIWETDLAKCLRNHDYASEKCRKCIQFPMCGGGCPLELACGF